MDNHVILNKDNYKHSYAGFINTKTHETKVVKLSDSEDYNEVQDFVHKIYGEDYKLYVAEFTTKAEVQAKLDKLVK